MPLFEAIIAGASVYYAHRQTRIADKALTEARIANAKDITPGLRELPAPFVDKDVTRNTALATDRPVQGRDLDLAALCAALTEDKPAAITNATVVKGGGGFGKTTLARYYIQTFHDQYAGIWWIRAENVTTRFDDLLSLAKELGINTKGVKAEKTLADLIFNAFARRADGWLLVFDNVDDPDDMGALSFDAPNIHVIYTSRRGDWAPKYQQIPLDLLEPDEALDLLMTETGRSDTAGGAALVEKLGHLPLAIVAAGGFLKQAGEVSFADFADDLDHALDAEPTGEYPDSVAKAVRLSYDAVSPDARAVLDLFAWLDVDALDPQLIVDLKEPVRGAKNIPEPLTALASTPMKLAAAIAQLKTYSLLFGDNAPYSLHRMAAAAIRGFSADAAASHGAAAAVIAAKYPQKSQLYVTWDDCRRLTPHALALAAIKPLPELPALGWLFNQAGIFLRNQGQFDAALDLAEKSLALTQVLNGPDHRATGAGHTALGLCFKQMNRLAEAETNLGAAVRIARLDADQKDVLAIRLSNHGGVLKDLDYFDRAEAAYREALEIDKDLHGPRSRQVAIRLNNLGTLFDKKGDRPAAIEFARQALDIELEQTPPDPPELGSRYNNLGSMLLENDELTEAETHLEKAYDIRVEAYKNPTHPYVLTSADWLITVLLMRAQRGDNPGLREARAKTIAKAHNLNFEQLELGAKLRLEALKRGMEPKDLIAELQQNAADPPAS